ncbi:MAG: hypothetical protein FWH03_08520 [Firmicutes bacterium]|nr:hypothetical protein [Bacillota bacterium]
MICSECGYTMANGAYKCLCCGNIIKSLRILSEEEQKNRQENGGDDCKIIDPKNVFLGRAAQRRGGGVFDNLFGGSIFGGSMFGGGSIFGSLSGVLDQVFGGIFGHGLHEHAFDDEPEEPEEPQESPKSIPKTHIIHEVEYYESCEPDKKNNKKKK